MENASKALLIAGGIFFAVLIISMMVYMSNSITEIGRAQNEKKAAEQLAAFNAQYEAYNKKLMYGTDVITVINKAIQHNGGLGAIETEEFIDVKIILHQDFIGAKIELDKNPDREYNYGEETLGQGTYNLRQDVGDATMNEDVINFFHSTSDSRKEGEGKEAIYYYDAISDFKRSIFQCNEMLDNNNDGKIDYMEFEQKSGAAYQ